MSLNPLPKGSYCIVIKSSCKCYCIPQNIHNSEITVAIAQNFGGRKPLRIALQKDKTLTDMIVHNQSVKGILFQLICYAKQPIRHFDHILLPALHCKNKTPRSSS